GGGGLGERGWGGRGGWWGCGGRGGGDVGQESVPAETKRRSTDWPRFRLPPREPPLCRVSGSEGCRARHFPAGRCSYRSGAGRARRHWLAPGFGGDARGGPVRRLFRISFAVAGQGAG